MIGTSCGIHIFSGGLLDCAGRIIVDDQVMLYTKGILRIGKQFGINKFSRIVGNNIWIGDKCTILKGVTIGDNVVIGANTLVHKDVPSGVVIGGVPFKILKNI